MKISLKNLKRLVEMTLQVEAEKAAKKNKKKSKDEDGNSVPKKLEDDEIYVAVPKDYMYSQNLDYAPPLGVNNLYHQQGVADFGPYTGNNQEVIDDRMYGLSKLTKEEFVRGLLEQTLDEKHLGFKKLVQKLAHKKYHPSDPKAVAASIGRAKYGNKKFQKMAAAGKKK